MKAIQAFEKYLALANLTLDSDIETLTEFIYDNCLSSNTIDVRLDKDYYTVEYLLQTEKEDIKLTLVYSIEENLREQLKNENSYEFGEIIERTTYTWQSK